MSVCLTKNRPPRASWQKGGRRKVAPSLQKLFLLSSLNSCSKFFWRQAWLMLEPRSIKVPRRSWGNERGEEEEEGEGRRRRRRRRGTRRAGIGKEWRGGKKEENRERQRLKKEDTGRMRREAREEKTKKEAARAEEVLEAKMKETQRIFGGKRRVKAIINA